MLSLLGYWEAELTTYAKKSRYLFVLDSRPIAQDCFIAAENPSSTLLPSGGLLILCLTVHISVSYNILLKT